MRILVLGGGLVGSAIARNLGFDRSSQVGVTDVNKDIFSKVRIMGARCVFSNHASNPKVHNFLPIAVLELGLRTV